MQIEQDIQVASCQIRPALEILSAAIFGTTDYPIFADEHAEAVKLVKEYTRALNTRLGGTRNWLVGDSLTIADIIVAGTLAHAFQLVFDGGF